MDPETFDRIAVDPDIMAGQPVIRGTRLPVYVIVESIAADDTVDDLRRAYPYLEEEDIRQALYFPARLSRSGLEPA